MNVKQLLISFVATFVVGLLVTALVTWLWTLIFDGAGVINWQVAFSLALAVGIAVPLSNYLIARRSRD